MLLNYIKYFIVVNVLLDSYISSEPRGQSPNLCCDLLKLTDNDLMVWKRTFSYFRNFIQINGEKCLVASCIRLDLHLL